jgi:DNA-directed RNA polymerase subunit RPC12/RpoP
MEFDAEHQMVTCEYCGRTFNPNETIEEVKASKEVNDYYNGTAFQCSQCGATLMTFDDTAITFCSYCGSQAMIETKLKDQLNPDTIIPFKVTREECIKKYNNLVSGFFFAPNYLKEQMNVEKFRGIYMPYVVYSFKNKGQITNKGEKFNHHSGNYDYYDQYNITADIDSSYEGMSYDLSSKFYDKFSDAIPHDYNGAVPFNHNYLIGYYADSKDVSEDLYIDDAVNVIKEDIKQKLRQNPTFAKYGCPEPSFMPQLQEKKTGLFPIYFLGIRDKNNNMNYAVVNGQTGAIAADLPISFKKYLLTVLVFAILIYFLINNFIILNPIEITVFSTICALISLLISNNQLTKLREKLFNLKDKGKNKGKAASAKNYKKLPEFKTTKGFRIKQVLGVIAGDLILLLQPTDDMFYYGASILILVLIVLSFYSLVKEHNMLSCSKPPQLEKRGGDL